MKQFLKFLKPVLVAVGLILILDSIVFPGMSAGNTLTNVLSFLCGVAALYFTYHYYKALFLKESSEILLTKEEQKKIVDDLKAKGLFKETKVKKRSVKLTRVDVSQAKNLAEAEKIATAVTNQAKRKPRAKNNKS